MNQNDWNRIAELVYMDGETLVVDTRFQKEFGDVDEELLLSIVEDNILEYEDDDGEGWEDIDWTSVQIEYDKEILA